MTLIQEIETYLSFMDIARDSDDIPVLPASPTVICEKCIGDLSQDEYEALTGRQFQAVTMLLQAIEEGHVSDMTSDLDLTPSELAGDLGLPADKS